jgi:hypothetical protein
MRYTFSSVIGNNTNGFVDSLYLHPSRSAERGLLGSRGAIT